MIIKNIKYFGCGYRDINDIFKSKAINPKYYKHIKSLKSARRLLKQERARFRKNHKNLLNDIYTYLRPGSKINTCGMGDTFVDKVIIELDPFGKIIDVEIPSVGNPKYTASCSWASCGGCVTLGHGEYIQDEDGNNIGHRMLTEAGPGKIWYYDEDKNK